MVLGPLPALLQRPLPAARRPARAAADRGARGGRRRGAVRGCSPTAIRPRRRRRTRVLVGSLWFAAAVSAWLFTGRVAVPARRPVRPRGAARRRRRARPARRRARRARDAGEPGRRAVHRPRRRRARGSPASAAQGTWLALGVGDPDRWRSTSRSRSAARSRSCSRPSSRCRCSPLLVVWLVPGRVPGAADRRRPLRGVRARRVRDPDAARRQRHPARRAVRRARSLLLVLWPRGRWVVLAVSLPLLYWQLIAPVRDVRKAAGDDSTQAAFYEPLIAELDRLAAGRGPFRVEIPPTRNRWEAVYVAERYPIARGWLRQLESDDFDLFKDGTLDAEAYRDWLEDHAVSYVAVPDAPRDVLAEDEVDLIDGGLDYLDARVGGDDWRLYRVDGSAGSASPGGTSRRSSSMPSRSRPPGPGVYPTTIEWSRYWRVGEGDGCVREGDDGRTEVEAGEAGEEIRRRAAARRRRGLRLAELSRRARRRAARSSSGIVSAGVAVQERRHPDRLGAVAVLAQVVDEDRRRRARRRAARRRAGRSRAAACAGRRRRRSRWRRRGRRSAAGRRSRAPTSSRSGRSGRRRRGRP